MSTTRTLSRTFVPSALLAVACCATPSSAQSQAFVMDGDLFYDNFGWSVDGQTDIDADGLPDVIVGGYRGNGIMGRIKVFSGATGGLIHHIIGAQGEGIGFEVSFLDDVNQDGTPDFIGSGLSSAPRVYSGLDASLLFTLTGPALAGIGSFPDQNSDGIDDIRVGNLVYSGAGGGLLRTLVLSGDRISLAGDVNNDGAEDYIDQTNWNFEAVVRSGADDSVLYVVTGTETGFATGVGDVNADGFDDFLASWRDIALEGIARVYSGADGSLIHSYENLLFPYVVSEGQERITGMGDVDGDGHDDFAMASEPPSLYSGATGCLMAQFIRDNGGERAFSIANAGDVDGDGDDDFVAGDPLNFGPNNQGTAAVFTYDGPLGQNYCQSTPNSTGNASLISASGSASIAKNNLVLTASEVPAGSFGLFFYGEAQSSIPFGDGFRCVDAGPLGIFRLPVETADTNDCLSHVLDNSSPPFAGGQLAPGQVWHLQAWFRDTPAGGAGFNLSNGLTVVFTP